MKVELSVNGKNAICAITHIEELLMKKMNMLVFLLGLLFTNTLSAYELINVPQLSLRIEDGNGFTVQQVTFNGQNVTLEDPAGLGKPRQIATYSIRPDSYIIQWTVSKQKGRGEEVTS